MAREDDPNVHDMGNKAWAKRAKGKAEDEERGKANGHASAGSPVILRLASSYQMEPMHWLWKHWLAQKKLHILAGVPGTAKTTIAINVAATISAGGTWPDGTVAPQGDVA